MNKDNRLSEVCSVTKMQDIAKATIRILDDHLTFDYLEMDVAKAKELMPKLLSEAENSMPDYGIESASDEIKKAFIALYVLYKLYESEYTIYNTAVITREEKLSFGIRMKDFIEQIEKEFVNGKAVISDITIDTHKTLNIVMGESCLTINFKNCKEPLIKIVDFFLNPKKYLDEFKFKQTFIHNRICILENRKSGSVYLCTKKTFVDAKQVK